MMAKKNQLGIMVTPFQKILCAVMIACAEIYIIYHSAMSVAWRLINNYEGIWKSLQSTLLYVVLGVGVLYVGYIFLVHPEKRIARRKLIEKVKNKEWTLFLIMLVLAFVSVKAMVVYHNQEAWWEVNRTSLLDLTGQVLIMFPFGCYLVRHKKNKLVRAPLEIAIIITLALEVFVLVRTFMNRPIWLSNGGGIGIDEKLALIINCNRNTTGLWGYTLFFVCGYFLMTSSKWLKPVYGLGLIINFMVIAMSKSRASLYSVCITVGLFCAIAFWYQKKFLNKHQIIKLLAALLIGVGVTVALFYLRNVFYQIYLSVSNIQELLGKKSTSRELLGLNYREEIWKASLRALVYDTHSFFFGVTPGGVNLMIKEIIGQDFYTHNQILEVGVGCGVPDMLVFITLCLMLFWDSVKICFLRKEHSLRNTLPSLGCFILLLGNMVEATLVGFNYLSGMVFAIACGAVAQMNKNKE